MISVGGAFSFQFNSHNLNYIHVCLTSRVKKQDFRRKIWRKKYNSFLVRMEFRFYTQPEHELIMRMTRNANTGATCTNYIIAWGFHTAHKNYDDILHIAHRSVKRRFYDKMIARFIIIIASRLRALNLSFVCVFLWLYDVRVVMTCVYLELRHI